MKLKKYIIPVVLVLCFIKPLYADEANLTIENAWISEAPPVSKVMVAYMTLSNHSDKAIKITNAESAIYSSIEFHETLHEDGMARMIRYSEITIPAHGHVQFKRGGKHFMLFNPTKHLKAGDSVSIKLSTSDNTEKTVIVPVKKAQY